MDGMPVANDEEDENKEGDHKKAGGFRRVEGVTAMLAGGVLAGFHEKHCTPSEKWRGLPRVSDAGESRGSVYCQTVSQETCPARDRLDYLCNVW